MAYIYSTLTNDQSYDIYDVSPSGVQVLVASVKVSGGHGRINNHFVTPRGVVTQVTDAELKLLKKCDVFNTHVKNGFIVIDNSKRDAEAVASEMEVADKSAQATPTTYSRRRKKEPVVNKD